MPLFICQSDVRLTQRTFFPGYIEADLGVSCVFLSQLFSKCHLDVLYLHTGEAVVRPDSSGAVSHHLQTSHRGCGNLAALEVTPLPPNKINALDCLQFANRMLLERAPLGCEPLTDMSEMYIPGC